MPRSKNSNPDFWRPCITAQILLIALIALTPACRNAPQLPPPILDRSAACSGTPWIGILKQPREPQREEGHPPGKQPELKCPPGWKWVFSSQRGDPPPGLQRFCRYVGDDDPRPRYRKFKNPYYEYHPFESIERDCRIVGPAASAVFPPQVDTAQLKELFLEQARGIGPQSLAASPDQVRLVIIDSVQDSDDPSQVEECSTILALGDSECSPHGEALVRLAQDLVESGSSIDIDTRRALAWTHEIRSIDQPTNAFELALNDLGSGSNGTTDNLSTAIRREVEDWWNQANRPPLILNLSVGWERINASDPTVKAQLVRAALEDAVCRGALVIAAAGNRVTGPPDLETPLLPAAWEQEPAPTPQECQLLLEPSAQLPNPSTTPYRPLVYAVGGAQHDGLPLSNSRPKATPRLVAFGDHVPVTSSIPPQEKILTGTSISTLVVSAAAAEHWRQHLTLSSFDVMEDLWDGGQIVGQPVDFCLDPQTNCSPGQMARRIVVRPPSAPTLPQNWPPTYDDSLMANPISLDSLVQLDYFECDPQALKVQGPLAQGEEPCPQRLFDIRVQPWVGPQPGPNHCSGCGSSQSSPATLFLRFDPCYRIEGKPTRVADFTLIVADKAYRLPIDEITLGDAALPCHLADPPSFIFTGFKFDYPPRPMYLAFTVDGQYASLSPILQVFDEGE